MGNLLNRLENIFIPEKPVKSEEEQIQENILMGLTNRINKLIVNETGMDVSPNVGQIPVANPPVQVAPTVTSGTDTDANNPAHLEFIKSLKPIMDKVGQKQTVSWGELEKVKEMHDKLKVESFSSQKKLNEEPQMGKVSKNNTKITTNSSGSKNIKLHNTDVVQFDDKRIVLNSGGWMTSTTKNRMNQTANQYSLGYGVYQKNGKWFVVYEGKVIPFEDGLELLRK